MMTALSIDSIRHGVAILVSASEHGRAQAMSNEEWAPETARVTLGEESLDDDPITDFVAAQRLDGRPFLLLGGGRGIGRQVAHALAQMGASVAVVDIDPQRANVVADEVDGVALVGDVFERGELERLFVEAKAALGPIRGMVNIVGFGHRGPLSSTDDAIWQWQFKVVVDHAFASGQIGAREIARAGGGSMVYVGSIAGAVTTGDNHPAYGSAKAALHQLVAYAGKEYVRDGVRVNAVAPGPTMTARSRTHWSDQQKQGLAELIPRGSAGLPSEIAGPILFLASDLSSFMTGQTLLVDGGLSHTLRLDLI
jgi:NAD(P)-dependent dehydrogenase (short-subunit alcohol dehydrogenase family)